MKPRLRRPEYRAQITRPRLRSPDYKAQITRPRLRSPDQEGQITRLRLQAQITKARTGVRDPGYEAWMTKSRSRGADYDARITKPRSPGPYYEAQIKKPRLHSPGYEAMQLDTHCLGFRAGVIGFLLKFDSMRALALQKKSHQSFLFCPTSFSQVRWRGHGSEESPGEPMRRTRQKSLAEPRKGQENRGDASRAEESPGELLDLVRINPSSKLMDPSAAAPRG